MRDIKKIYRQANSGTELLEKLKKTGKLGEVFKNFSKKSKNDMNFAIFDNEYIDWIETTWNYTIIYITDYTCIQQHNNKINGVVSVDDCSDSWTKYLLSYLQGEERKKYIAGLEEFANNVAEGIKQEILKPTKVEHSKHDVSDLKPEDSIIKQVVAKEQKRCTVQKRNLSVDESGYVFDKLKEQDINHSTNSI